MVESLTNVALVLVVVGSALIVLGLLAMKLRGKGNPGD